jgi:hypothetical protein
MKLEHTALYFPTSIGFFNLTLNNMGLGNIMQAMPLLLTAKVSVPCFWDLMLHEPGRFLITLFQIEYCGGHN